MEDLQRAVNAGMRLAAEAGLDERPVGAVQINTVVRGSTPVTTFYQATFAEKVTK